MFVKLLENYKFPRSNGAWSKAASDWVEDLGYDGLSKDNSDNECSVWGFMDNVCSDSNFLVIGFQRILVRNLGRKILSGKLLYAMTNTVSSSRSSGSDYR